MKIKVNEEVCVGCGACAGVAEDLFEILDSGLSHAKKEEVPADKEEEANEAIGVCPTGAIEEIK